MSGKYSFLHLVDNSNADPYIFRPLPPLQIPE